MPETEQENKKSMAPERAKAYIDAVTGKKALKPCPRCEGTHYNLLCETNLPVMTDPQKVTIGGRVIVCGVFMCSNCGAIYLHAAGPLGLMPEEEKQPS